MTDTPEDFIHTAVGCALGWAACTSQSYPGSAEFWLSDAMGYAAYHAAIVAEDRDQEQAQQAVFLRDIFGNPFRPVAFDPAWRSEAAVGIARGIYEDRAFERMTILADALQEAGCEHVDILTHCREPGEHVRGCWVVDLVLGKE